MVARCTKDGAEQLLDMQGAHGGCSEGTHMVHGGIQSSC